MLPGYAQSVVDNPPLRNIVWEETLEYPDDTNNELSTPMVQGLVHACRRDLDDR